MNCRKIELAKQNAEIKLTNKHIFIGKIVSELVYFN